MTSIKEFLWSIALKKGVQSGVKALLAFLGLKITSDQLMQFGVTVNFSTAEVALVSALVGLLDTLRNTLKQKYGIKWV